MVVDQQQLESIVTMKGKRTKRSRPLSPLALATTDAERDPRAGGENCSVESVEWVGPTIDSTEEEDMAHCLMLLAQGSKPNNTTQQLATNTKSNNNNNGSSYDCKTCNKSFPSFQALGGHRASHKKPKLGLGLLVDHQPKKSSIFSLLSDHHQAHQQFYDHSSNEDGIALSLHINNNCNTRMNTNHNNNNNKVAKVHECSICGAEFSSGQALGGHMRRHRPIGGTHATSTNPTSSQSMSMISGSPNNASRDNQEIKTQNFLSLDLNLPAPEDDHHHHQQQQHHEERDNSKFVFPLNGKTLIFSASPLVDCHY